MKRSKVMGLAALLVGLLSSACVEPTPTPSATADQGLRATGYPASLPTSTLPAGYPAQPEVPTATGGYPAGGQPARPTLAPTQANTATPMATATPVPTETPVPAETAAPTATTGQVVIIYRDFEIKPPQTTIKAGTEVTFLIENGVHQPYAGNAAPFIFEAPANLGGGSLWAHTFNQPGTLTILCGYHLGMTATLVVEP